MLGSACATSLRIEGGSFAMKKSSRPRSAQAALVFGFAAGGLLMYGGAAETNGDAESPEVAPLMSALGVSGGQIFLSGDDADDAGHCNGAACGGLFINLFNEALDASRTGPQSVPNSAKKILTIGVNNSQTLIGFNSWNNPSICAPVTGRCGPGCLVTNVTSSAQIAAANFADFNMIFLPSDSSDTTGGINPTQIAALNARAADIKDYINNLGGSLIALTEENVAGG